MHSETKDYGLKYIVGWIRSRIKHNKNAIIVINGETGCLTGDTLINVNRCGRGGTYTIKQMHKQFLNKNNKTFRKKQWNLNHPTYVRSYNGSRIGLHEIKDVVYSGVKHIAQLELENGKKIRATPNHKIMTMMGWKELRHLENNDYIMCDTLKPRKGIPTYSKIKEITILGSEDTYDIVGVEPHYNFVANGIVVHNSGKTFAGLTLANETSKALGTEFSIADNLDFNFTELLKKTMLEKNTKPGTVFLFEEVGAVGGGASAREWQSKANRLFNTFLQTTRHRRQVLIFTCPFFTNLEKSSRQLVHMQIIMNRIDFKRQLGMVKPYRLQVNDRTGKIYFKYLRYHIENRQKKLGYVGLPKPPQELLAPYEEMKFKYTESLNKNAIEIEQRKIGLPSKARNKVNPVEAMELLKKGYTLAQVGRKYGVSDVAILKWRRKFEKLTKTNSFSPNSSIQSPISLENAQI